MKSMWEQYQKHLTKHTDQEAPWIVELNKKQLKSAFADSEFALRRQSSELNLIKVAVGRLQELDNPPKTDWVVRYFCEQADTAYARDLMWSWEDPDREQAKARLAELRGRIATSFDSQTTTNWVTGMSDGGNP